MKNSNSNQFLTLFFILGRFDLMKKKSIAKQEFKVLLIPLTTENKMRGMAPVRHPAFNVAT